MSSGKNSSGLVLTGLDDHINPSQACIIPKEKVKDTKSGPKIDLMLDDLDEIIGNKIDTQKPEKVEISLTDCLACSGCITSAETVLISLQSHLSLYKALEEKNTTASERIIVVSFSPQSISSLSTKYNIEYIKTVQLVSGFLKSIGVDFVFDITVARDIALLEQLKEFLRKKEVGPLPMLASACPGWICYAEKTHPFLLDNIAKAKSPQQIMGTLIKSFFSLEINNRPENIYHATIMPCYDKKLEASRQDFYNDLYSGQEVDLVLTTGELEKMLSEKGHIDTGFNNIIPSTLDTLFATKEFENYDSLALKVLENEDKSWYNYGLNPWNYSFTNALSDGYLEFLFMSCSEILFNRNEVWSYKSFYIDINDDCPDLIYDGFQVKNVRNNDFREITLMDKDGKSLLKMASAYGFRNIQNVVRKLKNQRIQSPYQYIEIMACPSGCINGGGQLKHDALSLKQWLVAMKRNFRKSLNIDSSIIYFPHMNPWLRYLYRRWFNVDNAMLTSEKIEETLYTVYHKVETKLENNVLGLGSNW